MAVEVILAVLAEPTRLRIVTLLAGHPRSVGALAQHAGLRQPQASKHLQALERVGLVTAYRLGHRRVYALNAAPLRELAADLTRLADASEAARGDREVLEQYRDQIAAETLAATGDAWADGRAFTFQRTVSAPRDLVWRHWTTGELMGWWAPAGLRVSEAAFDASPGGRVVLEFREADDPAEPRGPAPQASPDEVMGRAEGEVAVIVPGERLAFSMSVLAPDGGVVFTGHYDVRLSETPGAEPRTTVDLTLTLADTTVPAAPAIAGIELGWQQTLDHLTRVVETAATHHRTRRSKE
jgi:uncharacterized protein YndB with AHSA1/START domain/DNA-binding transcriptional ArsR family regulator